MSMEKSWKTIVHTNVAELGSLGMYGLYAKKGGVQVEDGGEDYHQGMGINNDSC